jgi:hypothetical protein
MKLMPVMLLIAGIVFTANAAFAAPQWVYDRCWAAAVRVRPVLRFDEVEAYVANCIADWTAGTPPPEGRESYNRNRY